MRRTALGVQMLAYQIDGRHEQAAGPGPSSSAGSATRHRAELVELSALLQARSTSALSSPCPVWKTRRCACTRLRRARGAHGGRLADRVAPCAVPGRRAAAASRKTELLFVTLDKSEGYHDRIAYHDYAISAERFHWQTQNSAGPDTPGGRRYLESAATAGSSSCSCGRARAMPTAPAAGHAGVRRRRPADEHRVAACNAAAGAAVPGVQRVARGGLQLKLRCAAGAAGVYAAVLRALADVLVVA
jgi:hypothetical protein